MMTEFDWSNAHKKGMKTSLDSFYEWCLSQGIADDNVAQCLPKVKSPLPNPRPAPDHVWQQLLDTADPRERIVVLLAGEAGLRRAEIAQVHTDDLIEDMTGWSLIVHGKGRKQRVVPLTSRVAAEVRLYRPPHGYLFPGPHGHLSPHYIGTMISRLMPEGWSLHRLRHRFACRAYAGTRNLRAVQEVLGHASLATTEVYLQVATAEVRAACEAASWEPLAHPEGPEVA